MYVCTVNLAWEGSSEESCTQIFIHQPQKRWLRKMEPHSPQGKKKKRTKRVNIKCNKISINNGSKASSLRGVVTEIVYVFSSNGASVF